MRAVLFDVDDTLLDFRGADSEGFRRHLADLRPDLGPTEFAVAQERWRFWGAHFFARFTAGDLTFPEQRRHRARAVCADLGLPLAAGPAAADAWFAGYLRHCERALRAFPDAGPTLDALRAGGIRLGAVSNSGHANQDRRLRLVGLRDRLQAMVCVDDAGGVGKPDPGIFRAGCAALGVAPAEAAYVGDHLDHDARAATAAGLTGYWLDRAATGAEPGPPVLTGLAELVPLFVPAPEGTCP
ncbi:HAD family hydrolase [Plantactinospora mayteni]|uniref:Hydrolase n=1 Tax=Plantactinospora mayteni TaxID=566021 RepID=A0ABQ4EGX5_9ACTN|nr:HAD family hydrolase [Plantactinospora mayteni]GIG93987.1 hydrolase [Plantactinospora mayteni]